MAIAYDNSVSGRIFTGSTTSFICGSNAILFAVTDQQCTALSYNGVAMSNYVTYDPAIDSNSVIVKVWKLESPDSGTHDFTCTTSGGGSSSMSAATYTGHGQSQPEASENNKSYTSGPPIASTQVGGFTSFVVTEGDNAWAINFIVGGNNSPRTFTAGANTTLRTSHGDLLTNSTGILDSNGAVVPPGSRSLVSNWSSGSGFVSTVTISLAPPQTAGGFITLFK